MNSMAEQERNELLGVVREAVHDALETYTISVNSQINETRNLAGWIQYLAANSYEAKELTKELRDKAEVRKARHKVIEALSESAGGRFVVAAWGFVKQGAGWALGSAIAYGLWKWIAPMLGM